MPLKGIKVIELSGLAPGPLCGKFLRDFGASVTVVNKVPAMSLFYFKYFHSSMNYYFLYYSIFWKNVWFCILQVADDKVVDINVVNDGKEQVCLDIKSPNGSKIFRKLAASADVLIEPFRAG